MKSLRGPSRTGRSAGRRRVEQPEHARDGGVRRHARARASGSTHMRVRTSPGADGADPHAAPPRRPGCASRVQRRLRERVGGRRPVRGRARRTAARGRARPSTAAGARRRARRAQVVLQRRVQVGDLAVARPDAQDAAAAVPAHAGQQRPREPERGPRAAVRSARRTTAPTSPARTPPRCSPARRVRRPPPRRTRRTRARSANRRRRAARRAPPPRPPARRPQMPPPTTPPPPPRAVTTTGAPTAASPRASVDQPEDSIRAGGARRGSARRRPRPWAGNLAAR